jgi:resuscitation-promoting factor RpfB
VLSAVPARPRAIRALVVSVAAVAVVGGAVSCSPPNNPRTIAKNELYAFGFGNDAQFACLDQLWSRESGWNPNASNPSGAYGIPQALPGSKMASAGADWATNPDTQIRWGLSYIRSVYGSPCSAWNHSLSSGWY